MLFNDSQNVIKRGNRMINRREQNAEIFKDTEHRYKTDERLKRAVKNSVEKQKLILAEESIEISDVKEKSGKIIVSGKRTLEASENYAKQGKKVCIHNFASATNPGGGVTRGSSAQEEAICRCSTLYPCLNTKAMWDGFYGPHRAAGNSLYNDDCIFTPSVKVFKSDTDIPKLLQETDWWDVDVITCAAPNLRNVPSNQMNPSAGREKTNVTNKELKELLASRIEKIFHVAIANGAEILILGAFGCGAFCNPPRIVAEVFAGCTEKYCHYFDVIEFAVYHTEREKENYVAFNSVMHRFK